MLNDTKITALEAPEVATFKMVGIKKTLTISNAPKNWTIEQETKLDNFNNNDDYIIDEETKVPPQRNTVRLPPLRNQMNFKSNLNSARVVNQYDFD